MSERDDLLVAVADKIKTYRSGVLSEPNPEHVDRWLHQFTPSHQLSFIKEVDRVLSRFFIVEEDVRNFLQCLITNNNFAGELPATYWRTVNFLDIQKKGFSQSDMLKVFNACLVQEYGINISNCGVEGGDFVYLDDVIFSGQRVFTDLAKWVSEVAPIEARVHIVVMASHSSGEHHMRNKLNNVIQCSGKKIGYKIWRCVNIENRKSHKNLSEVLWPDVIPEASEVQEFLAVPRKYPLELRQPLGRSVESFSSDEGRRILESEFFKAGAKIWKSIQNPADYIRPLGLGYFGVGFGAMIMTYRNCPNNCPLALWWGDSEARSGALNWYPLLSRETYASARNIFR